MSGGLDPLYSKLGIESVFWRETADMFLMTTLIMIMVVRIGMTLTTFWLAFILMLHTFHRDKSAKDTEDA